MGDPHRAAPGRERAPPGPAVRARQGGASRDGRASRRDRPQAPRRPGRQAARRRRGRLLPVHGGRGRGSAARPSTASTRRSIGYEFDADQGLAGRAIAEGRAMRESEYARSRTRCRTTRTSLHRRRWSRRWTGTARPGACWASAHWAPSRNFSDADVEALATFATLASLALRNAESFEQRERQARRRGWVLADREPARRAGLADGDSRRGRRGRRGGVRRRLRAVLMPAPRGTGSPARTTCPSGCAARSPTACPPAQRCSTHAAQEGRDDRLLVARGRRALRAAVPRCRRGRVAARDPDRTPAASERAPSLVLFRERSIVHRRRPRPCGAARRRGRRRRSPGASCSRSSADRVCSRSSSPTPGRSSPASSSPARCSTRSSSRRRSCCVPTQP